MKRHILIGTTIHVLLPIVIGFLIYILIAFQPFPFFKNFLARGIFYSPGTPHFFYQILPDFFWAYSLTWALSIIYINSSFRGPLILSLLFCLLYECLQKINLVNGTFDPYDIVFIIVGCFSGSVTFKKYKKTVKK